MIPVSGLVLIFGIQRTRVLWDIVLRNKGTRAGLLRAGWVILLVISGELMNNIPVVWRLYPYLPLISWVTRERSDQELYQLASVDADTDTSEGSRGKPKQK